MIEQNRKREKRSKRKEKNPDRNDIWRRQQDKEEKHCQKDKQLKTSKRGGPEEEEESQMTEAVRIVRGVFQKGNSFQPQE